VIAVMLLGSIAIAQPTKSEAQPPAKAGAEEAPQATKPAEKAAPAETKPDSAPPAAKSDAAPAETKPAAAPAETKPVAPEPPHPGSTVKTIGYVVECVGLAGIVAGAVLKAMSSGKQSAIDAHCNADRVCDQQGMDAVSSASKLQTAGFATLAGGMAVLGVGIALVVSAPAGGGASASLRPNVVHGGAGLSVGGKF
jgi:hypothetical protein